MLLPSLAPSVAFVGTVLLARVWSRGTRREQQQLLSSEMKRDVKLKSETGPGERSESSEQEGEKEGKEGLGSKKRKRTQQPMTSRQTRAEGELEATEESYTAALETLKNLSKNNSSTVSSEFLSAQKALKTAKRQVQELKKRVLAPSTSPASWEFYPPPCDIPSDAVDPRFCRSFDVNEILLHPYELHDPAAMKRFSARRQDALDFFEEYGFVVFSNVLDMDECRATETEIWTYLEDKTPGLLRSDVASHDCLSSKRYGLPDDQAIFTNQILANRQNRRLYAALDCVVPLWPGYGPSCPETDDPGPNSVLVSHDRWCIYPPTHGLAQRQTDNPPVHLDICPWTYFKDSKGGSRRDDIETDPDMLRYHGDTRIRQLKDWRAEINCVRGEFGPHSQGVIALTDNFEEDGGTVVVPGFHKMFKKWQAALGTWKGNRVGQRRRGCSFNFHNPEDPIHKLSRRIPMRAGSLLLWNQCTVHGAVPNRSSRFRIAQFVRGVRGGEIGIQENGVCTARASARARAIAREVLLSTGGSCELAEKKLLPLSPHVFGVTKDDILNCSDSHTHNYRDVSEQKKGLVNKHWNI